VKFDNLRLAFEVVQVPQEMVEGIFSVLSSVLWLGNMTFKVNFSFLWKSIDSKEKNHVFTGTVEAA
jgi:myosin heavy subunit